MTPVHQQSSVIPSSCSSEQLFSDAEEVVKLTTDLAHKEDQFDRFYLKYYQESPSGFDSKARGNWALQQIKDEHPELWTEIDTMRARYQGLVLKSQIVRTAAQMVIIERELQSESI